MVELLIGWCADMQNFSSWSLFWDGKQRGSASSSWAECWRLPSLAYFAQQWQSCRQGSTSDMLLAVIGHVCTWHAGNNVKLYGNQSCNEVEVCFGLRVRKLSGKGWLGVS